MNVNALLVGTLDSLLPTADGVYKGAATEYIVSTIPNSRRTSQTTTRHITAISCKSTYTRRSRRIPAHTGGKSLGGSWRRALPVRR